MKYWELDVGGAGPWSQRGAHTPGGSTWGWLIADSWAPGPTSRASASAGPCGAQGSPVGPSGGAAAVGPEGSVREPLA